MDDLMFDPSMNCGFGFDTFDPISTGLPTPAQMNEAFSHLDPNIDVSGFGLADWKAYDPLNLDIRNPYVGGYPTLGSDWDPMLDYDPYAPYIFDNLKMLCENQNMGEMVMLPNGGTPMTTNQMPIIDMNADIMSAGMFPNMPSPEMAHALGLISDQDYAFLEMIGPKQDAPIASPSDPIEPYPIIGPSKAEWAEFDKHEAARADAVEKYHDCIANGNLDEASKWADKAIDEQYAKESIYDVHYVTDINQRAGLY